METKQTNTRAVRTPRDVRCPHCGAEPGQRCIGNIPEHQARFQRFEVARRKLRRELRRILSQDGALTKGEVAAMTDDEVAAALRRPTREVRAAALAREQPHA